MIKIVATIADFGVAANIGGDVERDSAIIEVPTRNIPPLLKRFLESKPKTKRWATLSFSLLDERVEAEND